jgi:hypothetical protein
MIPDMRMERLILLSICVVAIAVTAAPAVAAPDEAWRDAQRAFDRDYDEKNPLAVRVAAVRALANANCVEAVTQLISVLKSNRTETPFYEAAPPPAVVAWLALKRKTKGGPVVPADKRKLDELEAQIETHDERLHANARISEAARDALAGMTNADARAAVVKAATQRSSGQAVLCASLAALGGWRASAQAEEAVLARLETGDLVVQMEAADAAGRLKLVSAVEKLTPMIVLGNRGSHEGAAAAAIHALGQIGDARAIRPLMDQLAIETGRFRRDVGLALRTITGERLPHTSAAWERYWEAHGAEIEAGAFAPAPPPKEEPEAATDGEGRESFFGITVYSRRVAFLIDSSESMARPWRAELPVANAPPGVTTPIGLVANELQPLFSQLPGDAHTGAWGFSDQFADLVASIRGTKREGHLFEVGALRKAAPKTADVLMAAAKELGDGSVGTDLFTGLMTIVEWAPHAAIVGKRGGRRQLAPDTIYVVTDGMPNLGAFHETDDLCRAIRALNRYRRVTIHTIGIGPLQSQRLLERLATESGGEYVRR